MPTNYENGSFQAQTSTRSFQLFGRTDASALLIVALSGIILLIPMMVWGIPNGGDLPNHYRFAQPFYDSIRAGHFYPGWLAGSTMDSAMHVFAFIHLDSTT